MNAQEQVDHIRQQIRLLSESVQAGWADQSNSNKTSLQALSTAAHLMGYMEAMVHAGTMPPGLAEQLRPVVENIISSVSSKLGSLPSSRLKATDL